MALSVARHSHHNSLLPLLPLLLHLSQGNVRGLLGSLQTVLWEDSGWVPIGMGDLLEPAQVRACLRVVAWWGARAAVLSTHLLKHAPPSLLDANTNHTNHVNHTNRTRCARPG
jgi:hypothetical protein